MAKKEEKNIKDKTSFFKSFKAELKKVSWPTTKQLFNNTVAVIAIVLITALLVFVLDFAFEAINTYGIDKIKSSIANTLSTSNETVENGNVEGTENSVTENAEQSNATNSEE